MNLLEAFEKLDKIDLEESAKTDFIDKFGQDTFNNFEKAKQRLVNKGLSIDYGQYLKKDKKEVDDLILSLYDKETDAQKRRIIQKTDKDIRGKYRDLGIRYGYHVFEPLDVYASMDLGVNTGWCTTGRYKHYGHPEFTPSFKDAAKHWDEYTSKGIRFFYLLDPETMYGKYAIALYPKILGVNSKWGIYWLCNTNVEIYNDADTLDYAIATQIDLSEVTGEEIILEYEECKILYSYKELGYKENDEHVDIPKWVTIIGPDAFYGSSIKSVTIPEGVRSIGKKAFYDCKNLTSITIPNSVTEIGKYAFDGCRSLTGITIPDQVTIIDDGTFNNCFNLKSIMIPDSVEIIGDQAFKKCRNLTNITIPNSVTGIGWDAFYDCNSLRSIIIPDSVEGIGDEAFYNCWNLTSVTLPNSLDYLGCDVFGNGSSNLTIKTNNEYVKRRLQDEDEGYNIVSY